MRDKDSIEHDEMYVWGKNDGRMEALRDRVEAVEDDVDKLKDRVVKLEEWQWKSVGILMAGIPLCVYIWEKAFG